MKKKREAQAMHAQYSAGKDAKNNDQILTYAKKNGMQYKLQLTDGKLSLILGKKKQLIDGDAKAQMAVLKNGSAVVLHGKNNEKISLYSFGHLQYTYIVQNGIAIVDMEACSPGNENLCLITKENDSYYTRYASIGNKKIIVSKKETINGDFAKTKVTLNGYLKFVVAQQDKEKYITMGKADEAVKTRIKNDKGQALKGEPIAFKFINNEGNQYYTLLFRDGVDIYHTNCGTSYGYGPVTKIAQNFEGQPQSFQMITRHARYGGIVNGFDIYITQKDGKIDEIAFNIVLSNGKINGDIKEKCVKPTLASARTQSASTMPKSINHLATTHNAHPHILATTTKHTSTKDSHSSIVTQYHATTILTARSSAYTMQSTSPLLPTAMPLKNQPLSAAVIACATIGGVVFILFFCVCAIVKKIYKNRDQIRNNACNEMSMIIDDSSQSTFVSNENYQEEEILTSTGTTLKYTSCAQHSEDTSIV